MITSRGTAPVDLVGWITRDIGAELPEIAAGTNLAVAVKATSQADRHASAFIDQLRQSGRQCTRGCNMIVDCRQCQFLFLLQIIQRVGNQAPCGKALGPGAVSQSEAMAQNRNSKGFYILD